MAYYLWHLLRDAYAELGQLQIAQATGGSMMTLVDSKLIGTGRDDEWKDGAVIILAAGGSAPEGEFGRVSGYVDSTGTLSVAEMSAAIGAGDLYGLVGGEIPLMQMIALASQALQSLGDLSLVDSTSLQTAEGQTEYAVAAAWQRRPPRRVDVQTRKGDGQDHGWQTVRDWEYVPAGPGSDGLIVFRTQLAGGRALRVWFQEVHPAVSAYSDAIHASIYPALACAAVVEKALVWQNGRTSGRHAWFEQRLAEAREELAYQQAQHPIWQAGRVSRGLELGRD